MTSSSNTSYEEQIKEMNKEANAMGFDSIGHYMAEFQKNVKKMANLQRDGAKMAGVLKTCRKCQSVGEKRCTGCFMVWYCGRDCQSQDWVNHKGDCKKTRNNYEEVELMEMGKGYATAISLDQKKGCDFHHGIRTGPKAAQFVVKVQIALDGSDGMLVYNKDRDVQYTISYKSSLGKKIKNQIENNFMSIPKGYFYSIIRDGKNYINPQILPPETW